MIEKYRKERDFNQERKQTPQIMTASERILSQLQLGRDQHQRRVSLQSFGDFSQSD